MYEFSSPYVTSKGMKHDITVFWMDILSLYAMRTEILKFQNVPGVTSYESSEVLRFCNRIFCIQHIVITLSHHKYQHKTFARKFPISNVCVAYCILSLRNYLVFN